MESAAACQKSKQWRNSGEKSQLLKSRARVFVKIQNGNLAAAKKKRSNSHKSAALDCLSRDWDLREQNYYVALQRTLLRSDRASGEVVLGGVLWFSQNMRTKQQVMTFKCESRHRLNQLLLNIIKVRVSTMICASETLNAYFRSCNAMCFSVTPNISSTERLQLTFQDARNLHLTLLAAHCFATAAELR